MVQERIKTLRLLKGISQKEMAERLNKSVSAYSRMESGETVISPEELFEMAQILACSMDELFCKELTVDIHRKPNAAPDVEIQRGTENSSAAPYQFLLQQILAYQEKSEERMRAFMKELVEELNHQKRLSASPVKKRPVQP